MKNHKNYNLITFDSNTIIKLHFFMYSYDNENPCKLYYFTRCRNKKYKYYVNKLLILYNFVSVTFFFVHYQLKISLNN